MDMFIGLGYSESPLFAEFRRLEQQFDELFGAWTPWAECIRSLPAGTLRIPKRADLRARRVEVKS
jgi:hypothetical protein